MESESVTDHAYAANLGIKNVDDVTAARQSNVEVIKLTDLKDSADHDPLCMNDMNANSRDVNGTESASDDVVSKEVDKSSEEEMKDVKGDGITEDEEAGEVSDAKETGCEVNNPDDIVTDSSCTESGLESVEASNTNSLDGDSEVKQNSNENMDVIKGSDKRSESPEESSEVMDTAVNDENDYDTDDADEAVEMESQIKSDAGNGIIMSLTRKPGRPVKRKADAGDGDFKIISPSKFRKIAGISTRRSPRISTINGNSNFDSEGTIEEDSQDVPKNVGTGISDGDFDMKEDKSDNHSLLPNMVTMSDNDKAAITPKSKASPGGRKHLFFKGKKASPAQTKPLSPEELEKYSAPLDQGWKRELVYRGTYVDNNTKTQADTYYFPPTGSKLRSMVQITEWLSRHDTTLTPDNFTFMRRAIGVKGELVRNASQSRGRASMEAALKKRTGSKHVKDELVHDDNDGQYDKPEIVIERDSDDYIGQMMNNMNEEEKQKNEIKVDTALPKLEELSKANKQTSEIPVSTSANKIVTAIFVKKKVSPKATARKSTTQKTFKKSVSLTGVENLCSLNCPGLQGMPPMLHCNVCMCLFHQECVNFFGQNGDFVCLRCKDMISSSTQGSSSPVSTVLQASNPNLLKHLHLDKSSAASPTTTIVRAYPNGDMIQQVDVFDVVRPKSASPVVIRPNNSRVMTPPASGVPLYKALPFSTGTINPSPTMSMSTTLSYPVLLTTNTSFISPTSSSLFPVSIATPLSSSTSSSKSTESFMPRMSEFPEIRPLIKQEPIDDSYDDQKHDKNIKASSEALYSLKNVLSTRRNSNSEKGKTNSSFEKNSVENITKAKKPIAAMSKSLSSGVNNLPLFGNIFSPPQYNALPQNVGQPRMNFGNVTPPMQYGQNSGFRLVPVGPPVAMGGLQVPLPLNPSPGLVRMTNTCSPTSTSVTTIKSQRTPTNEHKKICPKPSTVPVVVSSQDDQSHSGPLVVNAKSVTPLNGQMLTLPPPVVKKLTLNKALALKINNKQITVPPSGFFHSDDGLKVFLPPNTFPTADENIDSMSVTEQSDKTGDSPNNQKDSNKTEKSENVDNKSADKLDIRKNKFYNKCCLMQRLYGMYDIMGHIFKYLTLQELLTVGLVCKTWRRIIQLPDLWTNVRFKNTRIKDWEMALKYICKKNVESVSLVGVSHFEDPNRTWHQLVSSVHVLSSIKKISFCHIPATVLQTIAGKLTQLESLCAEMITDFIDDSMWQIPSKFDVGNFSTMNELRELKLKGPGGLMLPSFNFGCGLSDLGKLSKLRVLHLTSLKNIKGSDFKFISSLINVEELALGDCEHWTDETYTYLKEMPSLRRLRLECGGDTPINGMALSSLTKLETLELWKYALASTFADHITDLIQLHHLCVYPDSTDEVAENNANTLNAVKKMTHLRTLDWVFQEDNSSTIILSDNDSRDNDQWIPFQSLSSEGTKDTPIEYISVKQLKKKHLEKALHSTKVNVFCAGKDHGL